MKTLTKFILPRYAWFMFWYKAFFISPDGIKGFAAQIINWLMQNVIALAEILKKENKRLEEAVKTQRRLLDKWYSHHFVEADEYDEVRATVRKLGAWITAGIIAETALNFFGISAVMLQQGWAWLALKLFVAIVLTGFGIYIFKKWFAIALNKPLYKQTETKPRNWVDFIVLSALCFAYESLIYYLCRIRGLALEGANGDDFFTYFVVLAGMILPPVAGYLSAERSLYVSPYKNTLRIAKGEKNVAAMESKIATNNERRENHFKRELQNSIALLEEFKIFKQNYNIKHGIKEENLRGHYSENYESFEKEAITRYNKEILGGSHQQNTLVDTKEQLNGHSKSLSATLNN
ncbi:MAG: hypothetical protein AAB638_04040 [Patescibacteria group bacterium]